jgi:YVTN family beta-propeller protein
MTHKNQFWAAVALLLLGSVANGQQFSHDISLSGLGNGNAAKPFGIRYEPSLDRLFVPVAGTFSTNNNVVAVIDPNTDQVVQTIPCGLFPEEVAFAYNANGNLTYGGITNSSDGSVTLFDANLQVVATVVLPDPFLFGTCYPYGIVAAADGSKFWVSTIDGSGEIYAIDLQTLSLDASAGFSVPFASGSQMVLHDGLLYAGTSRFNATWTDAEAGIAVIDPATGVIQETLLVPEGNGEYPGTQDFQVLADGRVVAGGLGFAGRMYVFEADGKLDRSYRSTTGGGANGLALDPSGEVLVICDLPTNQVVFYDLLNSVQISALNLGTLGLGYGLPNDAVFAHGKLYVTSQATEEVVVFDQLPDPTPGVGYLGTIEIDNPTPMPGDTVQVTVTGSGLVALAFARGDQAGSLMGSNLEIGPNAVLRGTAPGQFIDTGVIPNNSRLRGLHLWVQGGQNVDVSVELTAPKIIIVQ